MCVTLQTSFITATCSRSGHTINITYLLFESLTVYKSVACRKRRYPCWVWMPRSSIFWAIYAYVERFQQYQYEMFKPNLLIDKIKQSDATVIKVRQQKEISPLPRSVYTTAFSHPSLNATNLFSSCWAKLKILTHQTSAKGAGIICARTSEVRGTAPSCSFLFK